MSRCFCLAQRFTKAESLISSWWVLFIWLLIFILLFSQFTSPFSFFFILYRRKALTKGSNFPRFFSSTSYTTYSSTGSSSFGIPKSRSCCCSFSPCFPYSKPGSALGSVGLVCWFYWLFPSCFFYYSFIYYFFTISSICSSSGSSSRKYPGGRSALGNFTLSIHRCFDYFLFSVLSDIN